MLQAAVLPFSIPTVHARIKVAMPARPATAAGSACTSCALRGVCLPCDLLSDDLQRFSNLTIAKRRIARGASLYHAGERFESLFAVRSGAFKTIGTSHNGDEKVTGFYLQGEMLGLDAISAGRHGYSAVALEDSEVCAMSFIALETMAQSMPLLQNKLFRVLSSDISRDQGLMLLLGSMTAEQRLAAFLLSLSRRHQRLGFAADRYRLRMTRAEIGNYLGLTLETISRLLSRFQRESLITVQQRDITIKDPGRLREMVGHW